LVARHDSPWRACHATIGCLSMVGSRVVTGD
jgi:hypothetical protein